MALADFLLAVKQASQRFAPEYGLDPKELELALLTTAASEGGLGEEAQTGDGGYSLGRFQFHTNGGHGSTLLNQGYTREQIADDVFQANHWAPLMAESIVGAKANGYTGGEALRQAAFALERPEYIYPEDRWNSNISQATEAMGGAGDADIAQYMTSGQMNGGNPAKPATTTGAGGIGGSDPLADGLLAAAQAMHDVLLGDPSDPFALENFLNAASAYSSYVKSTGAMSPEDRAQQQFDNAISSGHLSVSQANAAWSRYMDKIGSAQTDAVNAISDVRSKNEALAARQATREQSSTPGLTGRGTVSQYVSAPYDETLNAYFDKYGVDPMQPPSESGAGVPGADSGGALPPAGTTTRQTGPATNPVPPGPPSAKNLFDDPYVDRGTLSGLYMGPTGRFDPNRVPETKPSDGGWMDSFKSLLSGSARSLPGAGAAGAAASGVDRWWRKLSSGGIPFYANGTPPGGHPGGPAVIGEAGMEMVLLPGMTEPIQVSGAQLANLPEGAEVIPMDEMYLMQQIQSAAGQGTMPDAAQQEMDASSRANDPNLEQKVQESLRKALAAHYAQNPPPTPVLGQGVKKDRWADWRALTGTPASGGPL